ncbi:helix-turn-helix transcriptional regulator [Fulvivirgaceae bacterium PWU20]|uniref:Helix-turn-helix transcriptional regulator n=2 Tax=Chryseosolibacter indicus TaxID=2782351 RepID=A0ABS5VUE1_9BACT|nr:helix-turn-helix domain-containing protein [Chryseosolibacter indicus]MBT1704437.1 helix-turn-helix transcriptional regulator [Chryseosolibacter indicus]
MADRFPRIVIQCLNGSNALHCAHYNCIYAASLKGITSKPALFQMEPAYSHVAVSFFPHGVKALFGVDAFETMDSVLDLQNFFSKNVIEKIIIARHTKTRISLLDSYLLKKLRLMKTIDHRVLNFLQLCPGAHYGRVLKGYGISERHFERMFLQSVGFTPSYYKRVVRFEKAHCRIQQGDYRSLASLAYESGYSDQSHFNREFKEFSGTTPLSFTTKDELLTESGSLLEA